MPDTGTQQSLPFPRRSTLDKPYDLAFPLSAEQAALNQRLDACRHILAYQGQGPAAYPAIIAIQGEVMRALRDYALALEKALSQAITPEATAAPRRKRSRRKP